MVERSSDALLDGGASPTCIVDAHCATGTEVCEAGRCVDACTDDRSCALLHGATWRCRAGHCASAPADGGLPAADGGELPATLCDPVCPASQVCDRGRCVDRCAAPLSCPADEVVEVGDGLLMDAFEASRPDATDGSAGCNSSRACSQAGRRPWTTVSWSAADEACAAAGKRLCTAAEWRRACQGGEDRRYPFGSSWIEGACNGGAVSSGAAWVTGSGPRCVSRAGAFDLSGNVAEWVADEVQERARSTVGGSYASNRSQVECGYAPSVEPAAREAAGIGFRCCR